MAEDTSLTDLADRIAAAGSDDDELDVREVLDALGTRSHYALLLVVAATAATPLSGIPGVTVACGLMIALIAGSRLLRRSEVSLPGRLERMSIDADRAKRVLAKIRPGIAWVDRHTHRRLGVLFKPPMLQLLLVICVLSGLTMPFLEVIPFSGSIVASGVMVISIALVTRDGAFALVAILPYCALAWLIWSAF